MSTVDERLAYLLSLPRVESTRKPVVLDDAVEDLLGRVNMHFKGFNTRRTALGEEDMDAVEKAKLQLRHNAVDLQREGDEMGLSRQEIVANQMAHIIYSRVYAKSFPNSRAMRDFEAERNINRATLRNPYQRSA